MYLYLYDSKMLRITRTPQTLTFFQFCYHFLSLQFFCSTFPLALDVHCFVSVVSIFAFWASFLSFAISLFTFLWTKDFSQALRPKLSIHNSLNAHRKINNRKKTRHKKIDEKEERNEEMNRAPSQSTCKIIRLYNMYSFIERSLHPDE